MISHTIWTDGLVYKMSVTIIGNESVHTNDFKIGIHSFPAWSLVLKGHCGEQAGKFTCCAVEERFSRILPS